VAAGLLQHWLSPNERRFIADRIDPETSTYDLWLCDVSGDNAERFTFDPATDFSPVWAPDGSRIVWASTRDGGVYNLYQKAASGAGEEMPLLQSGYLKVPTDWSRDGRLIIYYHIDPKTKGDVYVLPVPGGGEAKPFPVVCTEAYETAGALSPFEFRAGTFLAIFAPYAVTADGQRFLINAVVDTEPNAPLTVMVNWTAGLKK
jgi:hypothetical protein